MTISIAPEKDHWQVKVGAEKHSACLHKSAALAVARSLVETYAGSRVVIHEPDGTMHLDGGESIDDGGPDMSRILLLLRCLRPPELGLEDDAEQSGGVRAFRLSHQDFSELYGGKVTPIRPAQSPDAA